MFIFIIQQFFYEKSARKKLVNKNGSKLEKIEVRTETILY